MTAYNTNLVQNPGAEQGTASTSDGPVNPPLDWTTTSTFTEQEYDTLGSAPATPDGPADGGSNFFYGGPSNAESTATQDIAIGDLSSQIDAGNVSTTLSGELGGFATQNDHVILSVTWLDASGTALGTLTAPTVLSADRQGATELLPVTISGSVPAGTVTARVEMDSIRTDGADNDGYADNISLVLNNPTVCFASGTSIKTARGHVAVEQLVEGDVVATTSGVYRPIRWLGHRTLSCRNHPRPHEAHPVRIAAHAFGEKRPVRDLYVSPGHAICVDVLGEVLIPAIALVNGSTVQQVEVDEVTYWHVELDSHDIILAENLPAESYLDMGNRGFFTEAAVVDLATGPDANPSQRTHADFCRPFHTGGPLVDVVRSQLHKRAEASGWVLTSDLDLHLEVDGQRLDPVTRGLVARFHVPAGAADVWLVSPTARPSDTVGSGDRRDLGVDVVSMRIDDGLSSPRDVAIDDPLLCIGFQEVEDGAHRWTNGRAKLPTALWTNLEDGFYLRVELAGPPVPRWTAPRRKGWEGSRFQPTVAA